MQMSYNLRNRTLAEELRAVEESDNEEHVDDEESESEDNLSVEAEESDQQYDSESESDSDAEMMSEMEDACLEQRLLNSRARGRPTNKLRGKNGFEWTTSLPGRRSDRLSDVEPVFQCGPAGPATDLVTMEQMWESLLSDEILKIIVEHTNTEILIHCTKITMNDQELQSYQHEITLDEMRAYLAILYFSAEWKSSGVSAKDLWSNRIGFYRYTMNMNRFEFISRCLRFDDKATRNVEDRFSPIREIWEIFIKNCTACYSAGRDCTVDEILFSFRGRCKFRMYIKSKPDKYGLKFFALNDPETSYLMNALPYLGKIVINDLLEGETLSEYYFRQTVEPIKGSKRAVTCDNWFTSVPLLLRMQKEPYLLKMTGTIRKNKRELPAEMRVASKDPPESKFCHTKDLTLASYSPKKNKIVLVITTDMHSTAIEQEKPVIVRHYNKTKGGTESFDWLCHSRTVAKKTRRWSMRVFLGMLDIAAVNSRILFNLKNKESNKKLASAKNCLETLSMHLAKPHLMARYSTATLRMNLRIGIADLLDISRPVEPKRVEGATKKRCSLCASAKDRKTKNLCTICHRPICDEHRVMRCGDCIGDSA